MKPNRKNNIPPRHPFDHPFFEMPPFDAQEYMDFDNMSDEEFEEALKRRTQHFHNIEQMMRQHHYHDHHRERRKDGRLQTLSIRVRPHTKRFLKEDSKLTPREILETYEEFITGSERFKESLQQEKQELKKEINKIEDKLKELELFQNKLKEIYEKTD